MMRKLREKFTKWYFRKGYTFGCDFNGIETIGGDDVLPAMPKSMPRAVWNCPWYVKPFLFLFSPSVYCMEIATNYIYKGFMDGLQSSIENEFYKIAFKEVEQNNDKL